MSRRKPAAEVDADSEAVRLLDANLLIALAWPQHVHHALAHAWFARHRVKRWATCPLTQLAFVRISSNPKIIDAAVSPPEAAAMLARIVGLAGHEFWPCDLPVAGLAAYDSPTLHGHRQVTDAYLLALARHHGGRLATLDRGLLELLADAAERMRWVELVA